MFELGAVIISFFTIPILTKRKVSIGVAICACALVLSILSGLGIEAIYDVFMHTMTDPSRIKQYIVVIQIGILGVLLKKYDFIDSIIESLTKVINNTRLVMMMVPAIVGLLVVPGGAIISAPFIDRLGEGAKLSKTRRAIINLVFRHISMHIMPYSNGLLITALLVPQLSIYKVIGLNIIFITTYCIIGYFLYIRDIEVKRLESNEPKLPNLIQLLKYTSPIYLAVILNIGFKIPFYIGLLANYLAVYLLKPNKTFFKDIRDAFNVKIVLAIVGVYLIQGIMARMDSLNDILIGIFSSRDTIMLGIVVTSMFFGFSTGFHPAPLGVILPILALLPIGENQLLIYTHFAFSWGFLGYFFSPLHLCQLFTCEYLGVKTWDLYKDYSKFMLLLILAQIFNYFALSFIIL